jgi:uncharacterized protein (TIGR00645 family)
VLLGSRWGIAPFCLGLIAALVIVMAQFVRELIHVVGAFTELGDADLIIAVLKLVDLVLIANLVVMIIAAGVEIFLPTATHHPEDASSDTADIAALKPKLFASISAIAAIDLLESFINVAPADKTSILVEVAMLLAFVLSGVLLAWMERIESQGH